MTNGSHVTQRLYSFTEHTGSQPLDLTFYINTASKYRTIRTRTQGTCRVIQQLTTRHRVRSKRRTLDPGMQRKHAFHLQRPIFIWLTLLPLQGNNNMIWDEMWDSNTEHVFITKMLCAGSALDVFNKVRTWKLATQCSEFNISSFSSSATAR